MPFVDPAIWFGKYLLGAVEALAADNILIGSERVGPGTETSVIVSAAPGSGPRGPEQNYVINLIIDCPNTKSGFTEDEDGVDKAFVLAGEIDQLIRESDSVVQDGSLAAMEVSTQPFLTDDPLTNRKVVTMSVALSLVQGVL